MPRPKHRHGSGWCSSRRIRDSDVNPEVRGHSDTWIQTTASERHSDQVPSGLVIMAAHYHPWHQTHSLVWLDSVTSLQFINEKKPFNLGTNNCVCLSIPQQLNARGICLHVRRLSMLSGETRTSKVRQIFFTKNNIYACVDLWIEACA